MCIRDRGDSLWPGGVAQRDRMGSLPPGGGFRPALLWLRGIERGEGPFVGHVVPQVEHRVRADLSRQVDQGAALVASARSAPRRPCRAERARPDTPPTSYAAVAAVAATKVSTPRVWRTTADGLCSSRTAG